MIPITLPAMFLLISVEPGVASSYIDFNTWDGSFKAAKIYPESGGWTGGEACLPSAIMALDDVNYHSDLLPGYELVMHHYDSMCQPGLGAKRMYDLLYNDPTKLVLLSGCSLVTTLIAEVAGLYNLLVLSYGASSPALSNRERFPTLFRTHPSATFHNPTRVTLFKKFKWTKIAILQSVEEVFTSTAKDLERQCQNNEIRILSRQSFKGNPADAIRNLKHKDARIIVGLFYEKEARKVLCEMYKRKLYGPKYVWFLIGWYSDNWYLPIKEEGLNCTASQMQAAVQFHFTTEAMILSKSNNSSIQGMKTGFEFSAALDEKLTKLPNETNGYMEAPLAYDAIWSIAKAFNCTMTKLAEHGKKLEEFMYEEKPPDADKRSVFYREITQRCMTLTKFDGVSGRVMFSDSGDRIVVSQIEQLQDGKYLEMGLYDQKKASLEWHEKEKFFGGRPPRDSTQAVIVLRTVNGAIYAAVCFLGAVGILIAIAGLVFNFLYSFRRQIEMSLPLCNNVMLGGCVLCFLSLFLLGLPAQGLPVQHTYFTLLCHSRLLILMLGFSLAYGAMFVKVWLVYRLGAAEHDGSKPPQGAFSATMTIVAAAMGPWAMGRVEQQIRKHKARDESEKHEYRPHADQPVHPWQYCFLLAGFCLIDVLLTIIWVSVDPLLRKTEKFPKEPPPKGTRDDVMHLPLLEHCTSTHHDVWIGVVMGYKGIMLLFGLFLAYESRNLKLRFINDSRFVSLAVYNVTILTVITGPIVVLLIRSQQNANFGFVGATIILTTWISMGLIFAPKALYIYRVPPTAFEKSISKGGNTRKLTKEEEDKYKRLLNENEDIKRQIAEKEMKIAEFRQRLARKIAEKASQSSGGAPGPSRASIGPSTSKIQPVSTANKVPKCGNRQFTTKAAVEVASRAKASPNFNRSLMPEDSGYRSSNNGLGSGTASGRAAQDSATKTTAKSEKFVNLIETTDVAL